MDPIDKRLHILFIASWYPSDLDAQNGNFIQRHAEAVSAFCDVTVVHCIHHPTAQQARATVQLHKQVREIVIYSPRPQSKLKRFGSMRMAHEAAYDRAVQEFGEIDLVHVNVLYPAGYFASRIAKQADVPLVATEHATAFLAHRRKDMSWYQRRITKQMSRHIDMLCPVSEDLGAAMREFGIKAPQRVIANVVDTKLFQLKKSRSDKKFRWIHVSTLEDDHKNVTGIIQVFAQLSRARNDIELTLIGNGHHDQHRQTVADLGIDENRVRIIEELPIENIAQEMARHDAFVLFSNYENLPCVVSEAHACGLPVVATQVGGLAEMVDESNGLLIPAGDREALYQAMIQVQKNAELYDTKAIRERAVARYSYPAVAQKYLDVYQQVLSDR